MYMYAFGHRFRLNLQHLTALFQDSLKLQVTAWLNADLYFFCLITKKIR